MNAGRAVIVCDRAGCAPDLVRLGENGYVFEGGNVSSLMEALRSREDFVASGPLARRTERKAETYQVDRRGPSTAQRRQRAAQQKDSRLLSQALSGGHLAAMGEASRRIISTWDFEANVRGLRRALAALSVEAGLCTRAA